MPIYPYRCAECGHTEDFLQKISDPPIDSCPKCNSAQFHKQLTAAGFQLKGSGWYVTDFRDQKNKAPDKASQATADKGDSNNSGSGSDKIADNKSTTATSTSENGADSKTKTSVPETNNKPATATSSATPSSANTSSPSSASS